MPITRATIDSANSRGKSLLRDFKEKLAAYEKDSKRAQRKRDHMCKPCFYLREWWGGQGFTEYKCEHCGKDAMWSNTATPKLCAACAIQLDLCVRCCAGDIEAIERERGR
jgi:hypothetical protein